jgi:acetyl-CoA carboxylase biotin carboxyl carrier protein
MPPKKTADFDSKLIGEIAEIMSNAGLTEVELAQGDCRLRLSKQPMLAAAPAPAVVQAAQAAPVAAEAAPSAAESVEDHPGAVTSPMVGTVYLAPTPGADNFVSTGDQVKEGDTLMIIEAMKVMNPIPAPRGGTIKAILAGDTQPVEFGDPLIIIE